MERRDGKDEAGRERGKRGGGGCVRVRGEGVLLCTETILKGKGGDEGRSIQDSEEKEKDGGGAVWRGVGIVVEDGGSVRMQGGSIVGFAKGCKTGVGSLELDRCVFASVGYGIVITCLGGRVTCKSCDFSCASSLLAMRLLHPKGRISPKGKRSAPSSPLMRLFSGCFGAKLHGNGEARGGSVMLKGCTLRDCPIWDESDSTASGYGSDDWCAGMAGGDVEGGKEAGLVKVVVKK